MDELIEQFAQLRVALGEEATVEVREQQLTRLNEIFHSIYEGWLLMLPEAREQFHERYLRAQSEYHFIGNTILDQLRPPVVFHPSLLITQEHQALAMARDGAAADVTDGAGAPENAITNEASSQQPNQVSATGENEQNNEAQQRPIWFTAAQLETAVNSAVEQANWSSIGFGQYAQMLQPIFDLQPIEVMSNAAIDSIITAIQTVVDNAAELEMDLNQHSVRALILHIVATFDKVTKKCWLHRAKNNEPDFDFFISFLVDERSDEPQPKKFIIPKLAKPEGNEATQSASQPMAGPSGVQPMAGPSGVQPVAGPSGGQAAGGSSGASAAPNAPAQRSSSASKKKKATKGGQSPAAQPNAATNQQSVRPPPICPMCSAPHMLRDCPRFMGQSFENREATLFRNGWCINCLSPTHTVQHCLGKPCKVCGKHHNSILHHR